MKISEILIKSQGTRKQTKSVLLRDENGSSFGTNKPAAYCALGAIGCELGLFSQVNDQDTVTYDTILRAASVPDVKLRVYRLLYRCSECNESFTALANFIIHLNDQEGYSFKQIGDTLTEYEL